MISMIVFDMAGTTVDEDNLVYKTVQKAVNEKGFDFSLEEVLAVGAGKEKLQAIRSVLALKNIQDEKLANEIFGRFVPMLEEGYRTKPVKEQPHASELFRALKQRNIVVVLNTGYSRAVAESLLVKLDWGVGRQIDALVTASDVPRNRPNPDMILFAMKQFGIRDAASVIKVGDSGIDIEEGKNAGCTITVGITTGAHTRQQLAAVHPSFIIDDLLDLVAIAEGRVPEPAALKA